MSSRSSGLEICEPTQLYNFLTQNFKAPAVLDPNYLVLFDARNVEQYNESHILLAKLAKQQAESDKYNIPFGVHLPTVLNCIVYDSNTVSVMENTPAVQLATQLALSGSKNPVKVLKGGYERFSGEYTFLRTQKIMYTPLELQHLPFYPSEIIPQFIYLGDRRHAYNASLLYELKIHHQLRLGNEQGLPPAFPATTNEMHVEVEDNTQADLLPHFEKITEFLESLRKKSERVLVFSELGVSRAVTAVMAYLMYREKCTVKGAFNHVQCCREQVRPLNVFLEQLVQWEEQLLGERRTDIALLL